MEAESVLRHVGMIQKGLKEKKDARPVFGLFIAPVIDESVIAHFYGQYRINYRVYQGTVKVVPLALKDFLLMLKSVEKKSPIRSSELFAFFQQVEQMALNSLDESVWHEEVTKLAHTCLIES